jgi:uncharacterized protein (DUF2141 family)
VSLVVMKVKMYVINDKDAIIFAVEMAVDTNGDGKINCEEFNNKS